MEIRWRARPIRIGAHFTQHEFRILMSEVRVAGQVRAADAVTVTVCMDDPTDGSDPDPIAREKAIRIMAEALEGLRAGKTIRPER